MAEAKHDLGVVGALKPEALGVPGQRRFRLLVEGPGGDACLWVEKEQLVQLTTAVLQVLAAQPAEKASQARARPRPGGRRRTSLEFQVGNLGLGYDPADKLFLVQAYDREEEQEGSPVVEFWASRPLMERLVEEAQAVIDAGRPLCPLCNAPMGPEPHVCARGNGHRALPP